MRMFIAILLVVTVIVSALVVAKINMSLPDTEETIARLHSVCQKVIEAKAITEELKEIKDVSVELTFKTDGDTDLLVSTSQTEVSVKLDSEWNILEKIVKDLSNPFHKILIMSLTILSVIAILVYKPICSFIEILKRKSR